MIESLRNKLSGKKTYALLGFAIVSILVQFAFKVDLGVPAFPPAENIGDLVQQIYGFLMAGTFRAAIGKK